MTTALSLASRLQSMEDSQLYAAILARQIHPGHIADLFDLAEALLDHDSIQHALAALDRRTLAVIAAVTELSRAGAPASLEAIAAQLRDWRSPAEKTNPSTTPDHGEHAAASIAERAAEAQRLLLLQEEDGKYLPYRAVAAQLRSWTDLGLPSGPELAAPAPAGLLGSVPMTDTAARDRLATDRAFGSVASVVELLAELNREPARELQKGGLALPETKRVAHAMSVELEQVPARLSVAARANLVHREGGLWAVTAAGASWLVLSTAQRWARLADAWLDALPAGIRSVLSTRTQLSWGSVLGSTMAWYYPAGGDRLQHRVEEFTRDAEVLGITAKLMPSMPGTLLLTHGSAAAGAAFAGLFPPEVDQVYVQHDLTIVSPGPLNPGLDARLRTIADVESRAQASSYRISAASVNHAITGGESAASILEFLGQISLTGIPQPVEYLVSEAAARYGRLRVRSAPPVDASLTRSHVRSVVHADDVELLKTLEVDQTLASLGLQRIAPDRLASRFERDVVFWAISDARYPIAAEDDSGTIVGLRRQHTGGPDLPSQADPAAELVRRVRIRTAADQEETSQAWLARQLETSIRARVTVLVTLEMPDGRPVEYLLEPTGVAGGRLRGRDRRADVERTLPLSSITGLKPAAVSTRKK